MAKKQAFWMSYDLGLKGDYAGLYTFLDSVGANECGDSVAYFTMECTEDCVAVIKELILRFVKLNNTDRIYLIYPDENSKKLKGSFLFGGRKRSPWEGYAKGIEDQVEDFA